jgi:outer membrane protein
MGLDARLAHRRNLAFNSWVLLTVAGIVSGCGPAAEHEATNPTGRLKSAVIQRRLSSAPQAATGGLTLEQAIDGALAASPELGQIQARIQAADELVNQAKSSFYPSLVLAADYSETDNPMYAMMYIINQRRLQPNANFNNLGQQRNLSTQLQGQWTIYDGASRIHNEKAAEDQRQATEAELSAARNQMVASVVQTYYQWLQALSFVGVAQRSLESAQTDEKLAQSRLEAEMALTSEVLRLKTATAEAESRQVTARTSAHRLEAAMERLLARRIDPAETPDANAVPEPADIETFANDPNRLVGQALDRRPEMAAAAAMIQAADERVQAAKGQFLPRVSLHGAYELDSKDLSSGANSWIAGVAATWPLFEGGAISSRIREARSNLLQMQRRGEQVALDIALETQQSALAVREAAEKVRVAARQRDYAQRSLEEVRRQYENQTVTVDALLHAEVAWNRAEVGYTSAVFDARIAQAQLRRALGDFVTWMEKPRS